MLGVFCVVWGSPILKYGSPRGKVAKAPKVAQSFPKVFQSFELWATLKLKFSFGNISRILTVSMDRHSFDLSIAVDIGVCLHGLARLNKSS